MVVRVDDRDIAPAIDRQGVRVEELAGAAPRPPPDRQRLAVEREFLDAMVAIRAAAIWSALVPR
jgi:hypothetical protein